MALNRFYSPVKYQSRNEVVSLGVKCVFISHQKKDKEEAKKVAEYLEEAGIDIYFDEYDLDLRRYYENNNPNEVTRAICKGINNSSHMLVLVSKNTLTSTWVPFEVGYGYDKTDLSVLCLKGIEKGGLPEYIRTAKIVRDLYDLNYYISRIKNVDLEKLVESYTIKDYASSINPLGNVLDRLIVDNY